VPQFDRDRKLFIESFPGMKCFQTFDDNAKRKSRKLIYQVSTDCDQYPIDGEIDFTVKAIPPKIISDLEARNEYGACISLTINENNGKGRKASDITQIRAVWGDFDGSPLPDKWDQQPSMIVETSPGRYHNYWFTILNDEKYSVPLDAFTSIQEGISKKYNSDLYVKDLPKAMRMPGFYHCKGERFLSRIIDYTGERFDFGLLVALFPPISREIWSSDKYKEKPSYNGDNEFKGQYGCSEGGRNHHLVKRAGGMIKKGLSFGEIESELWKEAAGCVPPLPDFETRSIIKSVKRYC